MCTALPAAIYEPAAIQGILAAHLVQDAMERFGDDLGRQNRILQQPIDTLALPGSKAGLALPT